MHTVAAEQVGFSSERLSRIDRVMQTTVDRGDLPGLVTVVERRGKVAHLGVYGMADREAGRSMTSGTIFRIYSMTKPVTSVLAMMLVEEGRFALQEPVSRYIPGFTNFKVVKEVKRGRVELVPAEREIKIRDLLLHTSGLGYGVFEGHPIEDLYREALQKTGSVVSQHSVGELTARVSELPLALQPGTGYYYGLSTDVLAHLAEVVTDTPLDELMRERIFRPLGMTETGFFVPESMLPRFSALYALDGPGNLVLADPPEGSPFARPDHQPGGGTGLVSTAGDYLRFALMLLGGGELEGVRLLAKRTHRYMVQNQLAYDMLPIKVGLEPLPGLGWGLGMAVHLGPSHGGSIVSPGSYSWGGLSGTAFWVDPQEDLVALFLPQVLRLSEHVSLVEIFQNLVYQAITD